MASSILSYIPLVNRLVSPRGEARGVDVAPVEVHRVHADPEKRPRTLKHLLRANHANHSVVYHNLQYDNHMPHILCSAYLLGAPADHLHAVYDEEAVGLDPWRESPAEIVQADWRDFLGDKRYQRAYLDFFEDGLSSHRVGYEWKTVVEEYVFAGDKPLLHGLIGGCKPPSFSSSPSIRLAVVVSSRGERNKWATPSSTWATRTRWTAARSLWRPWP